MIELLMVIIIIGSLSVSAFPSFIDFRKEARRAAVQQFVSAFNSAIKNQTQALRLRCGLVGPSVHPTLASVLANDVALNTGCSSSSFATPAERRFLDAPTIVYPTNPDVNPALLSGPIVNLTSCTSVCDPCSTTCVFPFQYCYQTQFGIPSRPASQWNIGKIIAAGSCIS
jgi:type II secretory pathway pseudopilin PulG